MESIEILDYTPETIDHVFKIIIVGDSGVGKSSLFLRYSDNAFNDNFNSTIGVDFKAVYIDYNGKNIRLNIFDTAGQERFQSIVSSYFRGAHGILLVYDMTNKISFRNLKTWIGKIKDTTEFFPGIVTIGNKSDKKRDEMEVSLKKATDFANYIDIPHVKTSAKNGDGVNLAFALIVSEIFRKVPEEHLVDEIYGILPRPHENRTKSRCCQNFSKNEKNMQKRFK